MRLRRTERDYFMVYDGDESEAVLRALDRFLARTDLDTEDRRFLERIRADIGTMSAASPSCAEPMN
jgi:hypothetical protein